MSVEIRQYIGSHDEEIAAMILEIQTQEFEVAISREDQPDLSDIRTFYQRGAGNFWIAYGDGQVVGTTALIDMGNGQGAIRKMFVRKEWRGSQHHVASKLMSELIRWAQRHGIREIFLGTIPVYAAARRFYEKQGFTVLPKSALPLSFPLMKVDTLFYHQKLEPTASSG
ncbi:MAG: GNAT family N-acetyltransferase [Deltaproteobacteria bacterium]|nr:GNAT family N-acetyltransferase [Deltaproteobacteria bacterium]